MIVVRFKVRCQSDKTSELAAAMKDVVDAARELPGVIHFDIARDLTDADALIATEVFEDRTAMEREETLPEVAKVLELMQAGALAGRLRGRSSRSRHRSPRRCDTTPAACCHRMTGQRSAPCSLRGAATLSIDDRRAPAIRRSDSARASQPLSLRTRRSRLRRRRTRARVRSGASVSAPSQIRARTSERDDLAVCHIRWRLRESALCDDGSESDSVLADLAPVAAV